jgi:hypothetical protein
MRRHVIIGRFGGSDRVSVPTASGEVATRLEFVVSKRRLEHGIGRALDDLAKLGVFPSEIGVDLLVLAGHIHAADTRISRTTESQDTWTREIRLVVPVSDVARWSATIPLLQRMLNFLTGDRWTLGFRPRPTGFQRTVAIRPPRATASPFSSLALFSGGLDSLIGAIDILEEGATPLFISHAGEGATSDTQNALFRNLKRHYRRPFDRLRVWMNFPKGLVRNVDFENTTRARSFLFFAAGVFAATGLPGGFTLRVPENGLRALNVPLDPLRLGALSTRTTHPFYMARWNDLLAALGVSGRVENPYWNQTKGEIVAQCPNRPVLADLASTSLSCSSPTKGRWAGRSTEHCGYCLPCLIRRAALHQGLGAVDNTRYTVDLTATVLDTRQAEGEQVRSFQFAIERLRRRPQIAALLIHKPGPLSDESPARQSDLADVYRRGLEELGTLLAGVRAQPS